MNTPKTIASVSLLPLLALLALLEGCASHHVQKGALIGSLSGAALGAGMGYVLSEPDLLGPANEGAGGDTSLSTGTSVMASAAIGLAVGGIVGAMVGHSRDDGYEMPKKQYVEPPPSQEQQARAPYLRGL